MTREQAVNTLKELAKSNDPEGAHSDADNVLIELLTTLGYIDVVDAWVAISPKWYA